MPVIPLLSRGSSSSTSVSTSASISSGRGFSGYTSSSGSSSSSRGSSNGSYNGVLPGTTVPVSSSTDSGDSDSGDSKVAIYTVIVFFAVVAFCIAACVVYRCTRPCRRARKALKAMPKETPARQATEKFRANLAYFEERQRERRAVEAALILQMSFPVAERTRYNRGHRSVRPTETSTMGPSAEVPLARPEPVLHRPRSTNGPSSDSRPSTPLPPYSRYDPLRKEEQAAELHPEEGRTSDSERDNPSPTVE